MADESGRAVKVYRLDGGAPKDRGIYRCSECSWVGHEVGRSAPHSHAQSKHGGRGVDVVRAVPQTRGKRRLSTKPRAIRDREQKSRKSHGEMVASIHNRRPSEAVARWPVAVSTQGEFDLVRASLSPGRGTRDLPRVYDDVGKEGFQVAMTLVSINAARLGSWLGVEGPVGLLDRHTDLSIRAPKVDDEDDPAASAASAAALSLCLLFGGALPEDGEVVVIGYFDLTGSVRTVGDIRPRVTHCMTRNVARVLVPYTSFEAVENGDGWGSEELTEYAARAVRPMRSLVDMLIKALGPSFRPPPNAPALLNGPHVGVGTCMGYRELENVYLFQVQCCWTYPGQGTLRITGNMSDATKEAVHLVADLVEKNTDAILQRLGMPAAGKDGPCLRRKHADLHVHMEHGWAPVTRSYQCAAIYVAMVSLLIGRRPRGRVLVFSEINSDGEMTGTTGRKKWQVNKDWVKWAEKSGFREAVVGTAVEITELGARFAASRLQDRRPRMTFITKPTALDMISYVFSEGES